MNGPMGIGTVVEHQLDRGIDPDPLHRRSRLGRSRPFQQDVSVGQRGQADRLPSPPPFSIEGVHRVGRARHVGGFSKLGSSAIRYSQVVIPPYWRLDELVAGNPSVLDSTGSLDEGFIPH